MSHQVVTNVPTVCWQCFKSNHAACTSVHGKTLPGYRIKCQCNHKKQDYYHFVNPVHPKHEKRSHD